jgi:hypothetical protein
MPARPSSPRLTVAVAILGGGILLLSMCAAAIYMMVGRRR